MKKDDVIAALCVAVVISVTSLYAGYMAGVSSQTRDDSIMEAEIAEMQTLQMEFEIDEIDKKEMADVRTNKEEAEGTPQNGADPQEE